MFASARSVGCLVGDFVDDIFDTGEREREIWQSFARGRLGIYLGEHLRCVGSDPWSL